MLMTANNLLARIGHLTQKPITPRFSNVAELTEWHRQEALKISQQVTDRNRQRRLERVIGRSGIQPLHKNCSFKNYLVNCQEQRQALIAAEQFLVNFGKNFGGFVFSGGVGTGKNHLATAIAKQLIRQGKTAMIITIAEFLENIKASYDKSSDIRPKALMKDFCGLDLLILDEVGLSRCTDWEIQTITQIVDRRQLQLKPTAMLTNCNFDELVAVLGERVMDRQISGGIWVPFNWSSFRQQMRGQRHVK